MAMRVEIEREVRAVDGQLSVSRVRTMEQVLSGAVARQNFNMVLLSIFAGAVLVLAAIGIYGLMSFSVEQRMRKIGIRMALGANRGAMLRSVLREGMTRTIARQSGADDLFRARGPRPGVTGEASR